MTTTLPSSKPHTPTPVRTRTPVAGLRFHHIGVAVKSLEEALRNYTGLFGMRQISLPVVVPGEHVRVCFVEAPPGVLIELVEGLGQHSPVAAIVARTGAGPYHICYQVPDLDQAVVQLRRQGCLRLKRFACPGLDPLRFAFLLTPDRQLFELCEAENDKDNA